MIVARFSCFLVIGACGFLIDSGLTHILIASDISPFLARIPSIFVAMIFTWLANRKHTFRIDSPRSLREVARYSGVAAAAAALNYFIYLGLLLILLPPFVAIIGATVVVAVFSYYGYKNLVFDYPENG